MLSSLFSVYILDAQAVYDEEGGFAHGNVDNHTTTKSHHLAPILLSFLAQDNASDVCGKLFSAIDVRHNDIMQCKQDGALHKYGLWHNLGHP